MKTIVRCLVLVFSLFTSTNPLLAQWVYTNSFSGSVQALAVSGTNLFAGTWYPGIFLSTNNGTSWTAVNSGLTDTDIFALAVSGTDLYAGAESGGGTEDGGVFRSTNNGTNWTRASTGLTDPDVLCLFVLGTDLFAGTYGGGAFRSTNNGMSWVNVNSGLTNPLVFAFAVIGPNIFAGTGGGGVFVSTNGGTSWAAVNFGLTNLDIQALAVMGPNLFAGTQNAGIFLSTNNGTSWTPASSGLTYPGVRTFAVSGTNLFAGTGCGGVFLSTNNGTSWTQVNAGFTGSPCVQSLVVSGTNLFAGTYQGDVWRRPLSEMITLDVTVGVDIIAGWNMISNPVTRAANTDSVRQLYPNSVFNYAFAFDPGTGYVQSFTMPNGTGFWGKFPAAETNNITGTPRTVDSIDVFDGWNMVGTISNPVDTATVVSVPPGLRASDWYGFSGGYSAVSQLLPGKAYWVKSNGAGKFVFTSGLFGVVSKTHHAVK